jgi:hypothetical protein
MYGVKVTGDDSGGVVAVYEDKLGGNIYAQKISSEGKKEWGEKGVLLGASYSNAYSFSNFDVISDGFGGAIIAWPDSTPDLLRPSRNLTRIDAEGKLLWQHGFIPFDRMIGDSMGGAIIVFDNSAGITIIGNEQEALALVRIDLEGGYPWGLQGVAVPRGKYQSNTLQITPDGSGGVIAVWEEFQYPPEAKPGETISTGRIYAQKINSEGKLDWGDSVLIYTTPENTFAESPQIAGDGSGGAIVVWHQAPVRRIEDGSPEALIMDVLVQRVDSSGEILWQENGLPLEINKAAGRALPIEPRAVSDNSGGAIIVWRDMRIRTVNMANLYAQRIDASGDVLWQPGGINVSADAINPGHMIVSDGTGGALVSYFFSETRKDLHVQKVGADGKTIWPENGVQVAGGDYSGYSIAPDGQGGVIIGWGVGKGTFSSEKAYVQRVSADGNLLWGEDGIRLNK